MTAIREEIVVTEITSARPGTRLPTDPKKLRSDEIVCEVKMLRINLLNWARKKRFKEIREENKSSWRNHRMNSDNLQRISFVHMGRINSDNVDNFNPKPGTKTLEADSNSEVDRETISRQNTDNNNVDFYKLLPTKEIRMWTKGPWEKFYRRKAKALN